MNSKAQRLMKLFWSTFGISAFTFGGGYVIIPLMQKTFVGKQKWIENNEMLDLTAIAQSSPGPIAVNAAILVGYKTAGKTGALISTAGAVLPPLIIISIISLFYQAFRDNRYVSLVMSGMSAGVAAVVIDVVITMGWDILKSRRITAIAMMFIAFILAAFFSVNVILIILAAGIVGYIQYIMKRKKA